MNKELETSSRESEIRKRAASDAIEYRKKAPDTKELYKEIVDPIAEKAFRELGISSSDEERILYLSTLVTSAGIETI